MLQEVKIQAKLNIYDYANIVYGGFDNIIKLVQLNPDFQSINVNLNNFVTKKLVYDDQYYRPRTIQIELRTSKDVSTIKSISGREGQNLYDICLMAYSGFDNFVKLCQDNNINSTNDHDVSFKDFKFDSKLNDNLSLSAVISKKGYVFATGAFSAPKGFLLQETGFYLLQENGFKIIIS